VHPARPTANGAAYIKTAASMKAALSGNAAILVMEHRKRIGNQRRMQGALWRLQGNAENSQRQLLNIFIFIRCIQAIGEVGWLRSDRGTQKLNKIWKSNGTFS
jgi:hypothetical protein